MLVEDAGLIGDRLAELRELGVKLAIDDFGTGYASLAHLRQLPADIIKIDPSFVSGLGDDPVLTLLTRTIVQVGRDLGMQVVAEGIEQPRQLAELREMGCGYGQGFLVARPMARRRGVGGAHHGPGAVQDLRESLDKSSQMMRRSRDNLTEAGLWVRVVPVKRNHILVLGWRADS